MAKELPCGCEISEIWSRGEIEDYDLSFCRLHKAAPDLLVALDHSCLRELFGEIEDSGTPEAAKLWSLCLQWFDVRDAAITKARKE